jgi:tRNA(Ile)-lysidine synthase
METADFVTHFSRSYPDLVGRSILVALSGGRDSVALLHLLGQPELDLHLAAAHVHHGLRGSEADADAGFCRELCRDLGIALEVLRLQDDDGEPATGEAAWRRRRYRVLLGYAAARSLDAVATAHHRDDVAEGVLVQLLRGAGPRAMAGIEDRSAQGVIRPLLPWRRSEITAWLEARRIGWREDSSNTDTDRLRNRVRHEVLPELDRGFPGLRNHLVNLAGALAEAEDFMAAEIRDRVAFADPWDPAGGVPLDDLRALPRALRSRWLHGQSRRLGLAPTTRRQIELFSRLLDEGAPRALTLGGRWRLRAAGRRLWAEPPTAPTATESVLDTDVSTPVGIPTWFVRVVAQGEIHPRARWRWRPRSDHSIITVRPVREDDRLPLAGDDPPRVRELLAEHLPRHLRAAWPLFCEDDMIHWVPGVWQTQETGGSSDRVVEVIRR